MPVSPRPATDPFVDATRCPLCGQTNGCAEEAAQATGLPQPPCWCITAEFPPTLREQVPPAASGRVCICARCAASAALVPTC